MGRNMQTFAYTGNSMQMGKHGTGYIKLNKLMKEVLAPEDLAVVMACRMKGYVLRLMFYCNESGMPILLNGADYPIDLKVSWCFTVFCSGCTMAHTFNFIASRRSLEDYKHMRGLTYG